MSAPYPPTRIPWYAEDSCAKDAAQCIARNAELHGLTKHLHTTNWDDLSKYYTREFNLLLDCPYAGGMHVPTLMDLAKKLCKPTGPEICK